MRHAPTGRQWTIAHHDDHHDDEVVVTEVGGTLRRWRRGGREILAGFGEDEACLSGRGQQLMPWPNRIRDGVYVLDGVRRQLAITEAEFGNASHGLVRWALWELLEQTDTSLTVGYRLHPQPGWEWHLDLRTTYAVTPDGLHVTTDVTNVGSASAPFGAAYHPYVAVGDAAIDEVVVTVPARTWVEVDERMLPVARHDVEGTPYDFRAGRAVDTQQRLDTAYTDVDADADGRWRVSVTTPGMAPVAVWAGAATFGWVQVFTAKLEEGQVGERGVAVEPMTCAAEAFNSGESLIRLAPGATWHGEWGISAR